MASATRVRRKVTAVKNAGQIRIGGYENAEIKNGKPTGNWIPQASPAFVYSAESPYDQWQLTIDELHRGPPFRSGGPFHSLRMNHCEPPHGGIYGQGAYLRADGLQRYVGGFKPPSSSHFGSFTGWSLNPQVGLNVGSSNFTDDEDMLDLGNRAYNKCKPNLEKASGAVFIAEMRDIPRMLKSTSKTFHETWKTMGGKLTTPSMQPKKIADDFLQYQFGWKPFLGDMMKFHHVFTNSERYIGQIARNNGKSVRRRVTLEATHTDVKKNYGTGCVVSIFAIPSSYYRSGIQPSWELREEIHDVTTGVGKFKYYRPEFDANSPQYWYAWNQAVRHMTIYGLRVSPSNVYRAIPWTWAIDWVSNAGDYVDRFSDIVTDGLASSYFYVMRHRLRIRKFIQILPFHGGDVQLTFSRLVETKERVPSNGPFGFSLSWDNLSLRQLAIAGALGITRTRPPGG